MWYDITLRSLNCDAGSVEDVAGMTDTAKQETRTYIQL